MMEVTQHHYGDILKVSLGHQQKNQIMKRKLLVQWAICAVAIIALVGVLSSAALGANPAEEMAKVGTTDPKGNSWLSIQNSIEQFGHPEFILRLFLSRAVGSGSGSTTTSIRTRFLV